MQDILSQGICRLESVERRWSFAGWATEDAHENTVRPRGYYRSCGGCRAVVLTLADVDDAMALCRSVLADWRRKVGSAAERVDTDNVLGDLYAWLWYLYGQWTPSFGNGGGTFMGYSSTILRRKIHRFVALDVGDPTEDGRNPKAHSRSLTDSYEGLTETEHIFGTGSLAHGSHTTRGGLDFALGAVALDPTGDLGADRVWVDTLGVGGSGGLDGFGVDEA